MAYHTWQATERVRIESRLLIDAFLNRGNLKFQDLEPPVTIGYSGDNNLGPGLTPFRDKTVPGSHLVCEVRVMSRIGEGVVGIQLVMAGGGKRTQELPVRGTAVGEKRSTRAHRFVINTPVERLSRFDCEHNDRLIERLRVVTSGGRVSPWFGDRLTAGPTVSSLPDWREHSLAATMSAVAEAARSAASLASSSDGSMLAEERDAAAAAAEKAPKWDVQKEYITGLVGVRTPDRLVGLGVITRHVTNSHVFSYLWEPSKEDYGGGASSPRKNETKADQERSQASDDKRSGSGLGDGAGTDSFGKKLRSASSSHGTSGLGGGAAAGRDSSVKTTSGDSMSTSSASQRPSAPAPTSGRTSPFSPTAEKFEGRGVSEKSGRDASDLPGVPSSSPKTLSREQPGGSISDSPGSPFLPSPSARILSRAETKQEIFAQDMRDREKKKEELARLQKQKELDMERLTRTVNPFKKEGDSEEDSSPTTTPAGIAGDIAFGRKRGRARPAPHEEFASMLRMRRTDARRSLERSLALSRAARRYRGRSDNPSALSSLPVVMGLASWLHEALLPQLVPLPVPAESIAELLKRGEHMLTMARDTKARAENVGSAVKNVLAEQRQRRRRQGVMSPAQRAKEAEERQV